MKIRCLVDVIDSTQRLELRNWSNGSELELTKDKIYVVLAISKFEDIFYYYIIGDETANYPLPFPIELFEVIDDRISKYWDCKLNNLLSLNDLNLKNDGVVSFSEWTLEKNFFYEKILEGDSRTLKLFDFYVDKMTKEYLS
ncbi:hypothetical protein [Pinibacter soli]|uniref:Immunity protein 63 domain-containing protein n=1 Tax=Pinibacter soli TaxID=3044211 RepID=A0ABT6RLS0_9BACT|nr:hypothetical protein [Pinibacter soli]MDI3322742.1 hypothetical protein [Pinibacter soli]